MWSSHQAVAAGSLVNLATILYLNSLKVSYNSIIYNLQPHCLLLSFINILFFLFCVLQTPATIAYTVCAFFSLQVLIGVIKVKKFDQREKLITGTA